MIPLVGLGVAAAQLERPAIEKDLTERAERALAAEGAEWAAVNFSGLDVVLSGNATDENEPDEAVAVLSALWGVGEVKNRARLPPPLAQPYEWIARRRDKRIRLQGHYPDRAMRQTIIGMTTAAMPGFEVSNRMRRARGVPPTDTWLAGLSFGLKQLALLKRGRVRLEDLALSIEGETEDLKAYKAVDAALKGGLPKGITLASAKIAPPVISPYTWSAQFAGGQLVLSGHVASEDARADVLAAARTAPEGTDIVDRMEPARGAPKEWAKAAAALIKEMVRLRSGSAKMKDAAVVVGGVAADEALAEAVRDGLRKSLPSEFSTTDEIRVPPPKAEIKPPLTESAAPAREPAPKSVPKSADPPAFQSAQAGAVAPPKAEDAAAPENAPPKAEDTTAPKAAEAVPPKAQDATAPKAAEAVPPKAEDTAAPKAAEAVPPKAEDTAAPKAAEAVPPKAEDAGAPKAAEDAGAPKAAEAVSPKSEDMAARKPAAPAGKETALLATPDRAPQPALEDPAAPSVDLAVCRRDLGKLAGANPIMFDRGLSDIQEPGREALGRIAAAIKACPGVRIAAEGHADIEGSPEHNQRLSVKRAKVVAEFLIEAGVSAERLETAGFGTSRPAVPNTTAQNLAKNRRTEIVVRP